MNNIWCIFSVENNYDQPDNNLVAWWLMPPTKEQICTALGISTNNDIPLRLVNGYVVRIADTDYRLRCIEEGVVHDAE